MRSFFRSILSLLTFLSGALFVHGQSYFGRLTGPFITGPRNVFYEQVLRGTDRAWYLPVQGPHERGGSSILKLDADGDMVYMKHIVVGASSSSSLQCIGLTADNALIAAFNDTIEQLPSGAPRLYMGFVKVSAAGVLQWSKRTYVEPGGYLPFFSGVRSVEVASDGSFFVGGFSETCPGVAHFQANGDLHWAKRLTDEVNGVGRPMALASDGAGGCVFLAPSKELGVGTERVVLGRFDGSGTLLWCKHFDHLSDQIEWSPLSLVRRTNGHLLVMANAYTEHIENRALLLDVDLSGTVDRARTYRMVDGPALRSYRTQEIAGGHLLFDWQQDGYGFTELDEHGDLVRTMHFPYRQHDDGIHVLGWENWTTLGNELSLALGYMVDNFGGGSFIPLAPGVMNMDLSALSTCGSEVAPSFMASDVPLDSVQVLTGTTADGLSMSSVVSAATLTTVPMPYPTEVCGLYVGVAEVAADRRPEVSPTLLERGALFTVSPRSTVRINVHDAMGRLVFEQAVGRDTHAFSIDPSCWGPGVYLVSGVLASGEPAGATHVVIQ